MRNNYIRYPLTVTSEVLLVGALMWLCCITSLSSSQNRLRSVSSSRASVLHVPQRAAVMCLNVVPLCQITATRVQKLLEVPFPHCGVCLRAHRLSAHWLSCYTVPYFYNSKSFLRLRWKSALRYHRKMVHNQ